jgi:hypothetical protein
MNQLLPGFRPTSDYAVSERASLLRVGRSGGSQDSYSPFEDIAERSHKETCSVPLTTATRSLLRASRSVFAPSGAESFQHLYGVVLPAIEVLVRENLHSLTQRVEQGGYGQRGDHYCLLLACECAKDGLGRSHAPEVHERQHSREGTADDGAVMTISIS